MERQAIFLVAFVVIVDTVRAFQYGGPSYACKNMIPGHNNGTQSSPSPYAMTVSSNTIRPGGSTTVILESIGDFPFKGFICAASELDDSSNMPVGTMSLISSTDEIKPITCSRAGQNTAMTHTSKADKFRVDFDWAAPLESFIGQQFKLRCTFVFTFTQCWTEHRVDLTIGIPPSTSETTSGNNRDGTATVPGNSNLTNRGTGTQGNNNDNNRGSVVSGLNDQNFGTNMGNNSPFVQGNGGNIGSNAPSQQAGFLDIFTGLDTNPITSIRDPLVSSSLSNPLTNSDLGRGNTAFGPIFDTFHGNGPDFIDPIPTISNNDMRNNGPVIPNEGIPSFIPPSNPLLTRPVRNFVTSPRPNVNRNRGNANNRNLNNSNNRNLGNVNNRNNGNVNNGNGRARNSNSNPNRNIPRTTVDPFFDTSILGNDVIRTNLVNQNLVRQNEQFLDTNFVQQPVFNFPNSFFLTQDAIRRFQQRNAISANSQRFTQQNLDMFQEF